MAEYKSFIGLVGSTPWVTGSDGQPELHVRFTESGTVMALRTTQSGVKVVDVLVNIVGQDAINLLGQYNMLAPQNPAGVTPDANGRVQIKFSAWRKEAERIEEAAQQSRNKTGKTSARSASAWPERSSSAVTPGRVANTTRRSPWKTAGF